MADLHYYPPLPLLCLATSSLPTQAIPTPPGHQVYLITPQYLKQLIDLLAQETQRVSVFPPLDLHGASMQCDSIISGPRGN